MIEGKILKIFPSIKENLDMSFVRQEVEGMSSGKYLKNRILKFDWSGRFIAGYQVDFLTDFVVDEDAGAIYAFVTDGTSDTLMKYSVSGAKGWQTAAAI